MHIELRVVDPTRFLETYHNGQDPASQVFTHFKQVFEYYTSRMEDMTQANLGPWLEKQIVVLSQAWGIQVMHPTWFFHAFNEDTKDNSRKEDIEQAAQRRRRELEIEYDLKLHEERLKRGLERERREFLREEKAKYNDSVLSDKKKMKVFE